MLYKLQFFQKLAFEIQLLKVDEVFFFFLISSCFIVIQGMG